MSLTSYSQSYIGFSGGYTNPLAYENISSNAGHFSINSIESKSGFYISVHIKERVEKTFNIGFQSSVNNLKIKFSDSDGGLGGGTIRDVEYDTYILHTQINFEFHLIKNAFYFSFGPDLAIPIYSYKKESGNRWSINSPTQSFSSQGKNNDGHVNMRIFSALTFEKKLSEKTILFINSQINYSLWRNYQGVKTLDFRLGIGIQFFLPNFKFPSGKSYILNKK